MGRPMSSLSTFALVCCVVFFAAQLILMHPKSSWLSNEGSGTHGLFRSKPQPARGRQPRRHVAIATSFPPHFEVYMPIAWTVSKLLPKSPRGTVQVYHNSGKFNDGYEKILQRTGMYDTEMGGNGQGLKKALEALIADVASNSLFDEDGDVGAMIDMIVFGTCEFDLERWNDALLRIWDSRPADQKFKIVCMVHNGRGAENWLPKYAPEWAARESLRIVTIAEHVAEYFSKYVHNLADRPEPFRSSLFEHVAVDVHYPVAPWAPIQASEHRFPDTKGLAHVAIMGNLWPNRREYLQWFEDLLASLKKDPSRWGYLPLVSTTSSYEPDLSSPLTPFKLHLVGSDGQVQIPNILKNVVEHNDALEYSEFYALIGSMDVIIPAYVQDENVGYYTAQSSSAVHTSVQLNVPILGTHRMRNSYKYINDDRLLITRPQALREVETILALRTGSTNHILNRHNSTRLMQEVDEMIRLGWKRPLSGFLNLKKELWKRNEQVIWSMLTDP
ncbi:hypothetical protein FRB95_014926 [Tulasnella sp. JGI-2019a]|nr:hypothetical protein FRB95_014926 [Tulasnella sp. JGI-2019a]